MVTVFKVFLPKPAKNLRGRFLGLGEAESCKQK
jgi:hypothetical protein